MLTIDEINEKLQQHNADIRITYCSKDKVLFDNGLELTNVSDLRKFFRRLKGNSQYLKYFDLIYSENLDDQIRGLKLGKSENCRVGGRNCQKSHKNKIKSNLNNGTPWNKGKVGARAAWNKGLTAHNDKRVQKISNSHKGALNPMYGRKLCENQKNYLSVRMKQNILTGKFTPNVKNSRTSWTASFNGKTFRSSWEALFFAFNKDMHYETVRIPYYYKGTEYIYIVDFEDEERKILYEIRPSSRQLKNDKEHAKFKAASVWAARNGYSFKIIDENWFLTKNPLILKEQSFDSKTWEKIKYYYETGFKKENRKT
jgi:hypothetical protein